MSSGERLGLSEGEFVFRMKNVSSERRLPNYAIRIAAFESRMVVCASRILVSESQRDCWLASNQGVTCWITHMY